MSNLQSKQSGESAKAYQAYLDYRDMGVSRSLRKLQEKYSQSTANNPPSKHLSTIEKWSSKHGWQSRVDEWQQQLAIQREKEAEEARIAERQLRAKLLSVMSANLIACMQTVSPSDIDDLQKLFRNFQIYMEQSRREHNDLPTERRDLTSDNQAIEVKFITTPVSQEAVSKRLEVLDLAKYVDDQSA